LPLLPPPQLLLLIRATTPSAKSILNKPVSLFIHTFKKSYWVILNTVL
jgi:hypothetical protein